MSSLRVTVVSASGLRKAPSSTGRKEVRDARGWEEGEGLNAMDGHVQLDCVKLLGGGVPLPGGAREITRRSYHRAFMPPLFHPKKHPGSSTCRRWKYRKSRANNQIAGVFLLGVAEKEGER